MSRLKTNLDHKKIRRLIWLVLTVFVLLGYSLQSVAGSAYYSMLMQTYGTVSSPPVILEEGNVTGVSTIYANSTSAKVSVVAPAWLSGWEKRVKITIDNNDVDSALSNFPILVYLSNSSSGRNNDDVSFVFDELQSDANRKKIAVTTSDGTTQCYVEIERWDDASEQAWLWVKVPSISSTTDTDLYLYYDSSKSDNTGYVDDTGSNAAQNVWDSNFKGVWHLKETIGGSGSIKDSTSNNNHGTTYGNPNLGAPGQIDNAINFDGIDDYISIPNSGSLQFTSSLTIEAWIKLQSFGSGSDVDLILRKGEANPNDYQLAIQNQLLSLMIEENDDQGLKSINSLSSNTWYCVTGTWGGSTRRVYLNGSEDGSGSKTGSIIPDTRAIYIGGRSGTDLSYGIIDEVRASNATRSAAWIKASYESERDDLLDFGSEERNIIDYVDNNTSNVDSSADKGTHGNFTAQQYGPDSVYDALTEGSVVGSITYENSAESYSAVGQSSHNFNYPLQKGSGNNRLVVVTVSWEDLEATASISSLTFGGTAMTKIADVTVGSGYSEYISLWYLLDSSLPSSPGSYNVAVTVSQSITREIYMAVAEYSGVKQSAPDDYDSHSNTVGGNTAITLTAAANGSVVVAGVGEGGRNVLTNTNNINNLQEQILTSSGSALGHHTNANSGNITVGWNNLNTREGMVGAVWQPASSYNLDLEVQWTNADYTQTNEELCIKTGTFSGSENLMVHAWNVSTSNWHWVMNLTASSWNNVSISSYLTSSNFTIRFKGGNEINDPPQDSWNIDATLLHVWTKKTYDYVLKVVNQVTNNWTVNLKVYNSFNIGRLSSLNISLYDGTSSNQIAVSGGSIVKSEGPPYNLAGNTTIYISISNLQATTTGTSYLYIHLKIQVPNTSTYILYVITFEIT